MENALYSYPIYTRNSTGSDIDVPEFKSYYKNARNAIPDFQVIPPEILKMYKVFRYFGICLHKNAENFKSCSSRNYSTIVCSKITKFCCGFIACSLIVFIFLHNVYSKGNSELSKKFFKIVCNKSRHRTIEPVEIILNGQPHSISKTSDLSEILTNVFNNIILHNKSSPNPDEITCIEGHTEIRDGLNLITLYEISGEICSTKHHIAVYAGSSHVVITDAWIDYIPSEESGLIEKVTRRTWVRIMNRADFQDILNNLSNPTIQNNLLDVYFCAPSIDGVPAHNPLLVFNLNNVDDYRGIGNLYQRISKYAFMREPPKQKRNSTVIKGSRKGKSISRKSTDPYYQREEERFSLYSARQKQLEEERQRQIEEEEEEERQRQIEEEEEEERQRQIEEEEEEARQRQIEEMLQDLEETDALHEYDFGSGKKRRSTKKRKYKKPKKSKTRRHPRRRRPYI